MKKNHKTHNQLGAATLMFALFMVIIISLIAVGFAFIVRNDQRATLDKTLSNQAQYAAESAINKISKGLNDGTITQKQNANCNGGTPSQTPNLLTPGVSITCLTWSSVPSYLRFGSIGTNPIPVPIRANTGINSIVVEWSPKTAADTGIYAAGPPALQIASNRVPSLKIVLSNADLSTTKVVYVMPSTVDSSPNMNIEQSGELATGSCAITAGVQTCKVTIQFNAWNPGPGSTDGNLAISSIGGPVSVGSLRAWSGANGTGTNIGLLDAQVEVDVTARSQDVIKRLKANVPLVPITWKPGFAASADTLCKNFRLDGVNNNVNGPIDATACP